MQTIRTRYHNPSNTRGSRFSAQCEAGRIYVPINHALNNNENHMEAARQLIAKLGWPGDFAGGCFDGDYYWSPVIHGSEWFTVITSTSEAA